MATRRPSIQAEFEKWWLGADKVRLLAALDPAFSGVVNAARAAFEAGAALRPAKDEEQSGE